MGADESLAPFHPVPGHEAEWIPWPRPVPATWKAFLDAMLAGRALAPDAIFVGISFGGMVAQKLAERIRPRGIILIGSLTTTGSLPALLRMFKPILPWLPRGIFNFGIMPGAIAARVFGVREKAHLDLLYAMAKRIAPEDGRNLNILALDFASARPAGVAVRTINGVRDRIIRAKGETRDEIMPDGGHLISLTHAAGVNAALARWIGEMERA